MPVRANYCDYKVIVKGRRNACYAFFGSMSCLDDKSIVEATGTDAACTLRFAGSCKWSVDAYCAPWDGPRPVCRGPKTKAEGALLLRLLSYLVR